MTLLKRKFEILAALVALAAGPGSAPAQAPPVAKQIETADGSRFILVPWGSSPLIHWVQATPAGTAEDPAAYPGLSFAVARTSLSGTAEIGSKDWLAEELAMLTREDLELDRQRIEDEGGTPDDILLDEIKQHQLIADRLSDPLAWRRLMLRAPAIDLQLSEAEAVSLLAVTCTMDGLPKVARLLKSRRDAAVLRGLRETYNQIQGERALQQRNPLSALRHEILELALPGSKGAGESLDPNLYRIGKKVFERSQITGRCLHVITGGFNLARLEAVLNDIFSSTAKRAETPIEPASWGSRKDLERKSEIPARNRNSVAIAHEIPRGVNPEALAVLVDWLAQGPDSFLARGLRDLGHEGLQVQGQAPFPGTAISGLLLIEVWEARLSGPGHGPLGLVATIKSLLTKAAETGPSRNEFNQAVARARGQRSRALTSPKELAHHLALRCSVLRQTPEQAMKTTLDVSTEQVIELARKLFRDSPRSIVSARRQR